MTPGTTVRHRGLPFRDRTGIVVDPEAMDASWPGYVRVQLDDAPDGSQGARLLLDLDNLEAFSRAGQLGLFGGAP